MSVDYHSAYHVMGCKWTAATDNPTNAQLANDTSESHYDADLIPIVERRSSTHLDAGTNP